MLYIGDVLHKCLASYVLASLPTQIWKTPTMSQEIGDFVFVRYNTLLDTLKPKRIVVI